VSPRTDANSDHSCRNRQIHVDRIQPVLYTLRISVVPNRGAWWSLLRALDREREKLDGRQSRGRRGSLAALSNAVMPSSAVVAVKAKKQKGGTKEMKTKQLFGGALLAAGLTAASSGDFIITGNVPTGNYVGAYFGGFMPFSINADFWNYSAASGTAYALSQADAMSISNYGFGGDTGLAYALHFTPISFEVTADTNVTVSWDFTGDVDGIGGAYIDSFISVDGPSGNLAFGDLNNPVGSVDVALSAGDTYTFIGQALATGPGGTSQWSIVIPTPGAFALLGLAGLCGRRRRRG
jgi:MYXO-CTERM domain-containing protein